jgi:hypothetical protein
MLMTRCPPARPPLPIYLEMAGRLTDNTPKKEGEAHETAIVDYETPDTLYRFHRYIRLRGGPAAVASR